MSPNAQLLSLLGIVLAAAAGFLALRWLERRLKRPGLASTILGIVLMVWGGLQLMDGWALLPALFVVQGLIFLIPLRRARIDAEQGAGDAA